MKNFSVCPLPPSRKISLACLLSIAFCLSGGARAADLAAMNADVRHLDDGWAHVKYEINDRDEKLKDRKSTRLNSSHYSRSRMPSSA